MVFTKKKSGDSLHFALRIYDDDNQILHDAPVGLQVQSHLKSAEKIGGEISDEILARFDVGEWKEGVLPFSLSASETIKFEGIYACDVFLSVAGVSLHSETFYFEFEKGVTHVETV